MRTVLLTINKSKETSVPENMRVTWEHTERENTSYFHVEAQSEVTGRWVVMKSHLSADEAMVDCFNWYRPSSNQPE